MRSRRSITLCNPPRISRYTDQAWSLDLQIGLSDLGMFVLELRLLIDNLAESLALLAPRLKFKSTITVDHEGEGTLCWIESENCKLQLSGRDAEFLCQFLMEYYRDGAASVDHVDVEMTHKGHMGSDATLLVKVDNCVPPMPGDEAKRILEEMD